MTVLNTETAQAGLVFWFLFSILGEEGKRKKHDSIYEQYQSHLLLLQMLLLAV